VSPVAADRYRKLCQIYGGEVLQRKVWLIPHSVETRFRYTGEEKYREIICVGRWGDEISKRPKLLTSVVSRLLEVDDQVVVKIVGEFTEFLVDWHKGLNARLSLRISLLGRVNRQELASMLARARVFYSSSAFESFCIAAGEALCCGCSVVANRSVAMPAFEWFVSTNSGRLSSTDSVDGHVEAIQNELASWDNGKRDAAAIATQWCKSLHAPEIAQSIVKHPIFLD
jgi:glycosyltransferase involved in cell wall biosynthesis